MTKRVFTLLLCLALLLMLAPASTWADASGDYGSLHW